MEFNFCRNRKRRNTCDHLFLSFIFAFSKMNKIVIRKRYVPTNPPANSYILLEVPDDPMIIKDNTAV